MKKEKSSRKPPNFVFILIFAIAVALCGVSILIATIISIDRADELFNALRYNDNWHRNESIYSNRWEPFKNMNFVECVMSIPRNLYIGLVYFPSSFLVGVIFLPLMIFVVPVYEAAYLNEFTMLLMAWLPFMGGVAFLIVAGLMAEMNSANKKIASEQDNQPKL